MGNHWISKVSANHKEWVSMAKSFGLKEEAEDLVQNMYIRMLEYSCEEKFIQNGAVNKGYVWIVLRNMFYSDKRKESKINVFPLESNFEMIDSDDNILTPEFEDMLTNEMNKWHWYDRDLFKIYMTSKTSIRKMSKEIGISQSSIFTTIKNCKKRIKENLKENYILIHQ